jgi:8-oxo-dGTP pyrophosphatase MutT (NUDIX family)
MQEDSDTLLEQEYTESIERSPERIVVRHLDLMRGNPRDMVRKPFDFTASGYVVHERRVLLVQHQKLKKWLPPGGHMLTDGAGRFIESPEEAAKREIGEETGFDVEIRASRYPALDPNHEMLAIPESMHIHRIDEEHDHFGFDYFCQLKAKLLDTIPEETYQWFSEKELEAYPPNALPPMPDDVRAMALKAIRLLGQ